jgi:hypothetical protein
MHRSDSPRSPFRHVLGVPRQGVHAARLGPFARNDILATAALALGTGALAVFATGASWRHVPLAVAAAFLAWWAIATALHLAFGVDTALVSMLTASPGRGRQSLYAIV